MKSGTYPRFTLLRDGSAINQLTYILFVLMLGVSSSLALAETNVKEVIKNKFWGELYKQGGETFYCGKPFKRKGPLISPSYVYPEGNIRQHLGCGSKRQCIRDSEEYNRIASDLYNIVPARSSFELKRTNTSFGILDEEIEPDECGIRRKLHIIEPPAELRGDIARIILYMQATYDLPLLGNLSVLESWSQSDPPSQEEMARSDRIYELQPAR